MRLVNDDQLRSAIHLLVSVTDVNGTGVSRSALVAYTGDKPRVPIREAVDGAIAVLPGSKIPVDKRLVRLKWATDNGRGKLCPTQLGRDVHEALCREELQDREEEEVREVFLGKDDPLAYAALVSHLANLGPYMLVDPHLRFEQLGPLLSPRSKLQRILVSDRLDASDRSALMQTLEDMQHPIEIRIAEAISLHDRYAIGSSEVLQLGTSLNSMGTNSTTLIHLAHTAEPIRREYEHRWDEAADRDSDS